MKKLKLPSTERLKQLFWYDPNTGIFIRLKDGSIAGSTKQSRVPYVLICVDGKQYYAHRLAWVYMTGSEPKGLVDHKDTNSLNNKWENLREATKSQNGLNSKVRSTNKLGVKGISKNKQGFLVRICLGTYDTLEEAIEVYNAAIMQHFGEFAKLSEMPQSRIVGNA